VQVQENVQQRSTTYVSKCKRAYRKKLLNNVYLPIPLPHTRAPPTLPEQSRTNAAGQGMMVESRDGQQKPVEVEEVENPLQ